jgi:DNA-binding LytR/AlgR family response regulator
MKVIIIEDEQLAAERLELLLRQYDPGYHVLASLRSIRESVKFLNESAGEADLLLVDVQLADGPAFEIFRQVQPGIPIIFTTAYDQYALEAFQLLSVDYLLKPVTLGDMARALGKIKLLRHSADRIDYGMLSQVAGLPPPAAHKGQLKSRFLCRTGQRLQVVPAAAVAFFAAEGHVVRLVAQDGAKYLIDYTLEELEGVLDPVDFFRVNRSTILNAAAIGQVRPVINNRLRVSVKVGGTNGEIIVSRERVADFKKWADS